MCAIVRIAGERGGGGAGGPADGVWARTLVRVRSGCARHWQAHRRWRATSSSRAAAMAAWRARLVGQSLRCCAAHPADRTRRQAARIVSSAGALQLGWLPRATAGLATARNGRASRAHQAERRHGPWAHARTCGWPVPARVGGGGTLPRVSAARLREADGCRVSVVRRAQRMSSRGLSTMLSCGATGAAGVHASAAG